MDGENVNHGDRLNDFDTAFLKGMIESTDDGVRRYLQSCRLMAKFRLFRLIKSETIDSYIWTYSVIYTNLKKCSSYPQNPYIITQEKADVTTLDHREQQEKYRVQT